MPLEVPFSPSIVLAVVVVVDIVYIVVSRGRSLSLSSSNLSQVGKSAHGEMQDVLYTRR